MSVRMAKKLSSTQAQLAMGREDRGHADVVIKYWTQKNPNTGVTWLHPELGCSARNNTSIEQCAECEAKQRHSCCCTRKCVVISIHLGSAGLLCCVLPFIAGPKCRFKYITMSASKAVLTLTGGITESGPPPEGAMCYVFGRHVSVVADKLGGTFTHTPVPLGLESL